MRRQAGEGIRSRRQATRPFRQQVLFGATTGIVAKSFFDELFRYLTDRGWDVALTTTPDGGAARVATSQGARFISLSAERAPSILDDMRTLRELLSILRERRPDITVWGTPKVGLLGTVSSKLSGVPSIYVLHGLRYETMSGRSRGVFRIVEMISCRLADQVVAVGPSVRRKAIQDHLCPPDKIEVLGSGSANGYATPTYRATARADLQIDSDAVVVGFVGRVTADKGIAPLLRAWSQISAKFPNAVLIIAGMLEPDATDGEIHRLLNTSDQVRLLGHVDDLSYVYSAMDILVLPSRREGLPSVTLEAASYGVPSIVSDATGVADGIVPGQTGLVFETDSVTGLTRAIETLAENAAVRRQMGDSARQFVAAAFSRPTVHANWADKLQGLADNSGHGCSALLWAPNRRRFPSAAAHSVQRTQKSDEGRLGSTEHRERKAKPTPIGECAAIGAAIGEVGQRHGRVLWLSKGLDRGGAETLMLDLATGLVEEGFEVHALSVLTTRLGMRSDLEGAGVSVGSLGVASGLNPLWVFRLISIVRHGEYSVIHAHSPLPASIARIACVRARNRPLMITTEHAMRGVYRFPTRILNQSTSRLDDVRIAVSSAVADSHAYRGAVVPEVIYHGRRRRDDGEGGVAKARFAESMPGLDLSVRSLLVLAVANMRPEKNLGLLVSAFQLVVQRVSAARLIIVGDGAERKRIEDAIKAHGLEGYVSLVGHQPSVWPYLARADVFVLSSDLEGLPVTIMEAMLAGVPVVCTDVGGISEIVRDGIDGYLVPTDAPGTFADRLTDILRDSKLRRKMASSALRRSVDFSADSAARRHAQIYSTSMKRRPRLGRNDFFSTKGSAPWVTRVHERR